MQMQALDNTDPFLGTEMASVFDMATRCLLAGQVTVRSAFLFSVCAITSVRVFSVLTLVGLNTR